MAGPRLKTVVGLSLLTLLTACECPYSHGPGNSL